MTFIQALTIFLQIVDIKCLILMTVWCVFWLIWLGKIWFT